MSEWTVHPAAELFPLLADEELRELAEDIREHGLNEPVWLWEDPERGTVLLDGRNRRRACEIAGVPLATRMYSGDDPIAFSISQNLKRRHLTAGQIDMLALKLVPLYREDAKRRQGERTDLRLTDDFPADLRESSRRERESTERAAKAVGASGRGVAQAKRVLEKDSDLAEQVAAGTLAIDRADREIRQREKAELAAGLPQGVPDPARLCRRPARWVAPAGRH